MPRSLKYLYLLALILALPSGAPAQTPAPSGVTLKANARLVVVDVVVTDRNQNPVHNLKQADFTVLESDAPQTLTHFEEHVFPNPHAAPPEPMPKMPRGVFTNYAPTPPGDSLNIILLDTLNTPMKDQVFVRDQLKQYLKTATPGVRTAIFGLTTHLILLQSFTSDPEILKSILNKKNPAASPLLDDAVAGVPQDTLSDQLSDTLGSDPTSQQVLANLQQFEAIQQSFQLQLRARYTLDAMNLLARYLSNLPGRKNLIWFSGSFPITILPDGDLQNPFAVVASAEDEFRETTSLLTTAQVAVYPVDARGLFSNPSMDASSSGRKFVRNPAAFAKDQDKFFQQTANEHGTMLSMAEETGGRAFINTNGLSQAVASAINSGSNYYTLSYSPTTHDWDGKFRKIQVHLQQQGLTLSYRRGYYATDPNVPLSAHAKLPTPPPTPAKGDPPPLPPPDPMAAGMMRGAPDPTQIIFQARILPATLTTEDALAPATALNPKAKLAHGPYRRYLVDISADARPFLFTKTATDLYTSNMELRIYIFDQEGSLIVESSNRFRANLKASDLRLAYNNGIPLHTQISVPSKGTFFMRVGVHDLTSDRLGAIEIPIAAVKNLPPLPPSNPTPSAPPAAP